MIIRCYVPVFIRTSLEGILVGARYECLSALLNDLYALRNTILVILEYSRLETEDYCLVYSESLFKRPDYLLIDGDPIVIFSTLSGYIVLMCRDRRSNI